MSPKPKTISLLTDGERRFLRWLMRESNHPGFDWERARLHIKDLDDMVDREKREAVARTANQELAQLYEALGRELERWLDEHPEHLVAAKSRKVPNELLDSDPALAEIQRKWLELEQVRDQALAPKRPNARRSELQRGAVGPSKL